MPRETPDGGSAPKSRWRNVPIRDVRKIVRAIVFIVCVLGVVLFFWATMFRCPIDEVWTIVRFRLGGAYVLHSPKGDFYSVGPVRPGKAAAVLNAGLRRLNLLRDPQWLDLEDTDATDEALVYLEPLTNVEQVSLGRTNITDAGLSHLVQLHCLRGLNLNDTKISDKGLVQLQGLSNLTSLRVMNTNVSNTGVSHLAMLHRLCELNLRVRKCRMKVWRGYRNLSISANSIWQGCALATQASRIWQDFTSYSN